MENVSDHRSLFVYFQAGFMDGKEYTKQVVDKQQFSYPSDGLFHLRDVMLFILVRVQ